MSRTAIVLRDAEPADAAVLLELWGDLLRRTPIERSSGPPEEEARSSIARVSADPDQRLVVAVIDDEVVGAVFLLRASATPLHHEQAVQLSHLQVKESARRHGVGRLLVECAVVWAEEKGLTTVLAAAGAQSRDANRFLARLGFGQRAVIRAATVAALRAGAMPLEPPACARTDVRTSRTVGQVLARRRSQRGFRTRGL